MIYFPQPPPSEPPVGGDQDKAPLLRAITGAELGVCAVVIAARVYTRFRLARNAGIDDWIMIATFVRNPYIDSSVLIGTDQLISSSDQRSHRLDNEPRGHELRHRSTRLLPRS